MPKTAAARHLTLPAPSEPSAPGPFAGADVDRVRQILSRSGYTAIEAEGVTAKVGGGSLDETTELLLQLGPLGDMLDRLDVKTKHAIRSDIRSASEPVRNARGRGFFDAAAWLVTARAAEAA